jgi:hypothetical protein
MNLAMLLRGVEAYEATKYVGERGPAPLKYCVSQIAPSAGAQRAGQDEREEA